MNAPLSLFPNATEARSALNLFSTFAEPLPAPRIWDLLRSRAVRATQEKLEFADGSSLLFNNPAAPVVVA
jgi:hypothetical protein